MPLRIVEIILPEKEGSQVGELLRDVDVHGLWLRQMADGQASVKVLIDASEAELVLDLLDRHFIWGDRARLLLYSVDATRPKIESPPEPSSQEETGTARSRSRPKLPDRISRDELEEAIAPGAKVNGVYVALIFLSAIIAAVGLMRSDTVLLIGAMVIAPLLGPNMALALGTTLADTRLLRGGGWTTAVGVGLALAFSVILGLVVPFDPNAPALVSRTYITAADLVLALAAGGAGALAFTSGVPAGLVGVMVAVALLPPAVAVGLLLGKHQPTAAMGALSLLAGNIICVNISAMVAFMAQGIRPRTWWDRDRAKRATWFAGAIWGLLLIVLIVVVELNPPPK